MNLGNYFWTIISLKPTQVIYQIKYRLFGYRRIRTNRYFEINKSIGINIESLDEYDEYISRFRPEEILENKIWLLNESAHWSHGLWEFRDKTHLWNFNLQYFEYGISLAASYKKTGDERYYNKLKELYEDWHNSCYLKGNKDAWHPYTTSLRIRNILTINGILSDCCKDWISLTGDDLYEQYQFLLRNLEKNLLGNHYFENLTTLYICSLLFSDCKNKKIIEKKLLQQIDEQILYDGMHFERSFMYHNLILENLIRMYKISDDDLRNLLKPKMEAMVSCVLSFEEDVRLPGFNDEGSNVSKQASQLMRACKDVAGIKVSEIGQLEYGGYYVIKQGLIKLIVDAGDFSPCYISGHGHCDMLSFEMYFNGIPVFVNSGTYQYQTQLRQYFRSTKAHNTVQIKGIEQSEIWGEHRTGRKAHVVEKEYTEKTFRAVMRDYKGNEIIREIVVNDGIIITDNADRQHYSYWHIHPDNIVNMISDKEIIIQTPQGYFFYLLGEEGQFEDITQDSWYSEEFGTKVHIPSFRSSARTIRINRGDNNG